LGLGRGLAPFVQGGLGITIPDPVFQSRDSGLALPESCMESWSNDNPGISG